MTIQTRTSVGDALFKYFNNSYRRRPIEFIQTTTVAAEGSDSVSQLKCNLKQLVLNNNKVIYQSCFYHRAEQSKHAKPKMGRPPSSSKHTTEQFNSTPTRRRRCRCRCRARDHLVCCVLLSAILGETIPGTSGRGTTRSVKDSTRRASNLEEHSGVVAKPSEHLDV